MITKPTVLVLGAGASVDYGFPTGADLKRLAAVDHRPELDHLLSQRHSPERVDEFRKSLRFSGQSSVDAFLEVRPEFQDIGKEIIAYFLIKCESESKLFPEDSKSWYHYLFQLMRAPFERFGKNELAVITFNYDRSLEHYLFTALRHSHNKSAADIATQLESIPIVHVYGQLAPLEWRRPDPGVLTRTYLPNVDLDILQRAASGIKIMADHRDGTPEFDLARKLLVEAEYIHFIGFGYDKTNLERLRVPWNDHSDTVYRAIYGSAQGLSRQQKTDLQGLCRGLEVLDCDANHFIRDVPIQSV